MDKKNKPRISGRCKKVLKIFKKQGSEVISAEELKEAGIPRKKKRKKKK